MTGRNATRCLAAPMAINVNVERNTMIRRLFLVGWLAVTTSVGAAPYPEKPITLIQGFAVGGNSDTIARVVGQALAKELGQQVIVEAKTGAGGNLASAQVAKAAPDGYTLILLTGGHAVSAAMYKKLAFDPIESFDWITLVSRFPFVLATRADSPIKSMADLVNTAKSRPGEVSYSSVGIGSTQHLSGELFQAMAGVQLNHIPYKGGAAPLQDVLGGRVDLMFDSVTVTRVQVDAGKLRALGVTSSERAPLLPAVVPIKETVPGFEVTSWTGIAAPKGLPEAVASRLHAAITRVLKDPAVIAQLEATGGVSSPSASAAEMKGYVSNQVQKWKKVVRDANIPEQ
jgi:tripartite-type tricarboxylate transporter receptor subunit TctC